MRRPVTMRSADLLAQQAEPFLVPLVEFFTDQDGPMATALIYTIVRDAGILDRILKHRRRYGSSTNLHQTEILTADEQQAEITKALYDKAMAGDVAAMKEWRDTYEEANKGQIFNVNVNIKDYRIKDVSLRRIAAMSERHFVHDILGGMADRLRDDEAPQDLRDQLAHFEESFQLWAIDAYAPKNG